MNKDQTSPSISKKKELFNIIKAGLISCVIGFVVMLFIQAYSTFMNTQDKAWEEAAIPYDVKNEWIFDNILRAVRFRTSFGNDDGVIAKMLQKVHYRVYLSAKSKIPDSDPFWIEFWEPATSVPKMKYDKIMHDEIIANLKLISSSKSKVENFNDYDKYVFVYRIFERFKYYIIYSNLKEETEFYAESLEASYPIIDEFTKAGTNFYNTKHDIYAHKIPENFTTNILVTYMKIIMKSKKETCNQNLRKNTFNKIILFIQKSDKLNHLENSTEGMLEVYNQQYKEYCAHNN